MNKLCKNKLQYLRSTGSKNEKKICSFLLSEPDKKFLKLEDMSSHFNISNSSVSRFIKKLKFPSFKHFIYDLNEISNTTNNTMDRVYSKASMLLNNSLNGEFYIISSRNSNGIGKLIHDRLNVIGIPNHYYYESKKDINKFLSKIQQQDKVILITMSGWSNIVSKGITELAKLSIKPNIFIFSANKWTKSFDKYDYIKWICLEEKQKNINDFETYNLISIKFLEIIFAWLNQLYHEKNSPNIVFTNKY